ncbi:MAG: helix-turn-helix domain-containing protein [Actinomycetota bacterium]|nr:helix-turn-helix domain-containing protein [Actinomycetota bacterium]
MLDVHVIEDPAAAAAALDPLRVRLLRALAEEPGSAANLAERVDVPRQKLNYHLRLLEEHGLVELAEVRAHGGIRERVLRATAANYVVSPAAVAEGAADPDHVADRLSAGYLIAVAGRTVREVGSMARRAEAAGKRLPTMAIDTTIGFRSAEDRAAFAQELTDAVLALVARYHHDDGRPHRFVAAVHPQPADESAPAEPSNPHPEPEEAP